MRNHADAIVACDFFVSITARFRILYVFVAMEIGSRRILHFNVTEHPTAEWTLQQLRETLPGDHSYRFLVHDRQGSFSAELDDQIQHLGVKALRSPVGAPTANAHCERMIGTMRRECLDFVIPIDEWHLRRTLRHWSTHYNCGVLIGHLDLASRMRLTENCRFVMVDMKFRWALGSHRSRFSVVFITSIAGKTRPHEMQI